MFCSPGTWSLPDWKKITRFTNSQAATALDEEGIRLWLAALRNHPALPSQPHKYYDLLEKLAVMLSHNFDILGSVKNLLVSYFVSNATFVLQVGIYVSISLGLFQCN